MPNEYTQCDNTCKQGSERHNLEDTNETKKLRRDKEFEVPRKKKEEKERYKDFYPKEDNEAEAQNTHQTLNNLPPKEQQIENHHREADTQQYKPLQGSIKLTVRRQKMTYPAKPMKNRMTSKEEILIITPPTSVSKKTPARNEGQRVKKPQD